MRKPAWNRHDPPIRSRTWRNASASFDIATDYLDLWFQIQCDQHRFVYAEKSAALRDRILANVDRALKLEVITQEDTRGCHQGTGRHELHPQIRGCDALPAPRNQRRKRALEGVTDDV